MKLGNMHYGTDLYGNPVWLPATEAGQTSAVDLTRATSGLMKQAATKSRQRDTETDPSSTSDETRQEDGDTLDDDQLSTDTDALVPDGERAPEGEDVDATDVDAGADAPGDGTDQDAADDVAVDEQAADDAPENKSEAVRLLTLQRNIYDLYSRMGVTLETLSDHVDTTNSEEMRELFNRAVSHLSNGHEVLGHILETPFTPKTYSTKIRSYVAMRSLYTVVIQILDNHFASIEITDK